MFIKGNKLSRGRPRLALTKPELLLPMVFSKGNVNWAYDFVTLYREMRKCVLSVTQKEQMKLLMELMPYLCTKIQLKELTNQAPTTPEGSVEQARQTSKLLKALEDDNVTKPSATSSSD